MKRFRILNHDQSRSVVYKCETTQEVYEYLLKQDRGLNRFIIECVVDDMEVEADEFMTAWEEGERPGDLQMF